MITALIWLLTALMVFDCLLLVLLVLVQLPKKEAGAGMAFGGGATEALFGAGSGNALTKITKYVATAFFVLALSISFLHKSRLAHQGSSAIEQELHKKSKAVPIALPPVGTNAPVQAPADAKSPVPTNPAAPPLK